jgi:predicted nucleic acid-binding protein
MIPADTILVDTSVWSLALRRRVADLNDQERALRGALESWLSDGKVQLLGVVRQELLTGIREKAQFEQLRRSLRAFRDVELAVDDYEEAARMSNVCRSAGISGSLTDFLICAVAAQRDWQIFTSDRDFTLYGKHLPVRLLSLK